MYPQYKLSPVTKRYLIPRVLLIVFLGALLYFGIMLNLNLLKIELNIYYKLSAILVSILLVIFASLEHYSKHLYSDYYFYSDRAYINNQWIFYKNVQKIDVKHSFLDRIFKTSTIIFGNAKMKAIPDSQEIHNYIRNLVQHR